METEIYLFTAATAIAVTAIYFFFVRKAFSSPRPQPARDAHDAQQ